MKSRKRNAEPLNRDDYLQWRKTSAQVYATRPTRDGADQVRMKCWMDGRITVTRAGHTLYDGHDSDIAIATYNRE